jgi:hypothetical protein
MATLNLTSTEFADIAMIWLLDQVMNPEQVQEGKFRDFLEKHSSKIKSPLIKYYLDTRGEPRVMYKRIKGVFDGSDKSIQQIRIGPDEEIKKLDKAKKGIVSKLINKIIAKEQLTIEDENMLKEIIENDENFSI